jgi:hypothetical protein
MNGPGATEQRVAMAVIFVSIVAIVVSIVAIVVTVQAGYTALALSSLSSAQIINRLVALLIASAFIERAVEVILTPWRAKGSEVLKLTRNSAAAAERPDCERDLAEYKLDSQRLAFWLSTALGTVVGACGFRALEWLVEAPPTKTLGHLPTQAQLLAVVDVVLTGLVLAGGADGVHKIIALFTAILDRKREQANEPPTAQ